MWRWLVDLVTLPVRNREDMARLVEDGKITPEQADLIRMSCRGGWRITAEDWEAAGRMSNSTTIGTGE